MLRTKKEKIALYAGYIIIMCITFLGYEGMGLYEGCSMLNRLTYPFFHQNVFHAAINLWVLHQCLKARPCGIVDMVVFYLIAISYYPSSSVPIIGLSGIVYAYMGYIAPFVEKKVRYNIIILSYICVGFFIPCMAVGIHIFCYVVGLLWGYLNSPICQDK